MNTQSYRTKSEIIERQLPRVLGNNQHKSKTIVALDGGYSSVKGASPNKVFMFPSYAKKAPANLEVVTQVGDADLQFRDDKTGEIWLVGRSAEILMNQDDVDATTDASLYTRYRYNSEIYKTIMISGLALGLIGTRKADEIFLQTGLPASYKDRDAGKLKDALKGEYQVSLKIGNNPWHSLEFTLTEDNIDVIEQPQGTLCSCIYNNGEVTNDGKQILNSKGTLILDVGFGTEDIFSVRSGYKDDPQTFSDTGMKSVFSQVVNRLRRETETDVKVFEFQSYLESGQYTYFDQEAFGEKSVDFTQLLEAANKQLCEKSIRRLMQEYNNLAGYQYLIVTGGTGESRFEQIKEMLSGMPNLRVLPGNINTPDLSYAYSNVIGYYMFRHANHQAEANKSKA